MMKMKVLLTAFLLALAFCVAPRVALAQDDGGGYAQEIEWKVGNKATELKVGAWVQGDPITRLDSNKVYVVDMWSPSAPLCKRSIPLLNELHRDLEPRGLVVVGIAAEKPRALRNYLLDKASYMTYPIASTTSDKMDGASNSESWTKFARHSQSLPVSGIINRAGQICYIGSPLDEEFKRVLMLALDDRYDPDLIRKSTDRVAAARRAAKIRNFREATRLYGEVVDLGPRHFADYALECWRMLREQAQDVPGAREYLTKFIERISDDEPTLVFIGNYMTTNTDIKYPDMDAAKTVAKLLQDKSSSRPDTLACIAVIQAATGDFEGAAETQYDAWMAAPPSSKAAYKRALDNYRAGRVRSNEAGSESKAKPGSEIPSSSGEDRTGAGNDSR